MRTFTGGKRLVPLLAGIAVVAASVFSVAAPAGALGGATLQVMPAVGLWDMSEVQVNVGGMPPDTLANLTLNVASDPYNQVLWLPGVQTFSEGNGQAMVNVPRFVNGYDCATAPGACLLVTADPADPFNRNASVPLSFGRIDLFRFTPNDPNDPSAGGTVGPPISGADEVAHGEWIWAQGTGFEADSGYQLNQCKDVAGDQLCRNTWNSNPFVNTDSTGAFGQALQVGRNVFGSWGVTPALAVSPVWDVRDGQTLAVNVSGLPPDPDTTDCQPGACWIGVSKPWADPTAKIRSDGLTFSGDAVPITVTVGEALQQQLRYYTHIAPALGMARQVSWNFDDGTLSYAYTAVNRWVAPDLADSEYSPPPVEAGRYDCADTLAYDPGTGAQEPVHCSLMLGVTETSASGDEMVFGDWRPLQFAAFDLTGRIASAVLSSKTTGVTLKGRVTCTGFSPEQYLVNVRGTLTQTAQDAHSGSGSRKASFATTVLCSGTMANPGTASWSVFVPRPFVAGAASTTLDLSAAGFTRKGHPVHVVSTITIRRHRTPSGGYVSS